MIDLYIILSLQIWISLILNSHIKDKLQNQNS